MMPVTDVTSIYFRFLISYFSMFESLWSSLLQAISTDHLLLAIVGILIIAWISGDNEENEDQEPVFRLISGIFAILIGFGKFLGVIFEVAGKGLLELSKRIWLALQRLGQFIDENVTIQIVLDGRFWTLVIILVLIGAGVVGWQTLGL